MAQDIGVALSLTPEQQAKLMSRLTMEQLMAPIAKEKVQFPSMAPAPAPFNDVALSEPSDMLTWIALMEAAQKMEKK